MSTGEQDSRYYLAFDVEPELRHRIEAAAAERRVSVRDYVVGVLQLAVDPASGGNPSSDTAAGAALSAPSFARNWQSDEDAVYDDPV